MRTHGWGGNTPASDEEAVDRILAAAEQGVDARGADLTIADVARILGVTRQTVYRYFPSTEALLVAAARNGVDGFLDRLGRRLHGMTNPAEAATEAIATALEWLPGERYMGLLLSPDRGNAFTADVTSEVAVHFAGAMLRKFDYDWAAAGFTDPDLDELAEYLLRIIQSFVIDPGRPPRRGEQLRRYLRRWVAPALRTEPRPTDRRQRGAPAKRASV